MSETRTCKVGVHGRNNPQFDEIDYQIIRDAKIEVIKMMSHSSPGVFDRLKRENPDLEIITRLYDDRIQYDHPTPVEFVQKMSPIIGQLKPYGKKFHVHNEPNHVHEYEGWGSTDEDARSFDKWFCEVYDRLKNDHPDILVGFPGLAVPDAGHRDRHWLDICTESINKADFLGCHCYWQTPPGSQDRLHLNDYFGLAFKYYHDKFPDKVIDILECGNSNIQGGFPISDDDVAQEYVEWLQEVFKYDYINSASFFILSSQDTGNWEFFSWRTEHNFVKPVVHRISTMHRPPLREAQGKSAKAATPTRPAPKQPRLPDLRPGQVSNQNVLDAFSDVATRTGLGKWDLLKKAGLKMFELVKKRNDAYDGPKIDTMDGLSGIQQHLVKRELMKYAGPVGSGVAVSFSTGNLDTGYLKDKQDLIGTALALPREAQIASSQADSKLGRRVVRVWNNYGWLLMSLADKLELDLSLAVALLACEVSGPGLDSQKRLVIRFEPQIFYQRWGQENEAQFKQHFRFDPARPWQGHYWRNEAEGEWQACHGGRDDEWAVFNFACSLDGEAAKAATLLGMTEVMGFAYSLLGYDSASQLFDAFSAGERYQVLGLFDYLIGPNRDRPALETLREQDLDAFAALHKGAEAANYRYALATAQAAFKTLNPDVA